MPKTLKGWAMFGAAVLIVGVVLEASGLRAKVQEVAGKFVPRVV